MSRASLSLLVFGVYLLVLGGLLMTVPDTFLGWFGLPPTHDVWIRVVAMLVLILGCYDVLAARADLTPFFRWSVWLRGSVIVFFAAFVGLGLVQPILLLFGVVDLAAATWTALALRADARHPTTTRTS